MLMPIFLTILKFLKDTIEKLWSLMRLFWTTLTLQNAKRLILAIIIAAAAIHVRSCGSTSSNKRGVREIRLSDVENSVPTSISSRIERAVTSNIVQHIDDSIHDKLGDSSLFRADSGPGRSPLARPE